MLTIKNAYPLPLIPNILNMVSGAKAKVLHWRHRNGFSTRKYSRKSSEVAEYLNEHLG